MKITLETTASEVASALKEVMNMDLIPNIILENSGNQNGFVSPKDDYQYWIDFVCDCDGRG